MLGGNGQWCRLAVCTPAVTVVVSWPGDHGVDGKLAILRTKERSRRQAGLG
jgi:hypothetical protein